jgi:hypothetical protein
MSGTNACKDCGSSTRKLVRQGPRTIRCVTCIRAGKKARSATSHEQRVQNVYGLEEGDYERIKACQGGKCFICQRATGAARRLSVDHDHATGRVRGLLCRPCNDVLGHARDDAEYFRRAVQYLQLPPASIMGIVAIHKDNR